MTIYSVVEHGCSVDKALGLTSSTRKKGNERFVREKDPGVKNLHNVTIRTLASIQYLASTVELPPCAPLNSHSVARHIQFTHHASTQSPELLGCYLSKVNLLENREGRHLPKPQEWDTTKLLPRPRTDNSSGSHWYLIQCFPKVLAGLSGGSQTKARKDPLLFLPSRTPHISIYRHKSVDTFRHVLIH